MNRAFFIAKRNMRKKKSDTAVLVCLIALAAMLLYTSISVLTNTGNVLDRSHEEHHTADYELISNSPDTEQIEGVIKGREEVEEFERTFCLYATEAKYRSKTEKEDNECAF